MTKAWRLGLVLVAVPGAAFAVEIATLVSPDGTNEIRVELDDSGAASYRVTRKGHEVLGASPLGLRCSDGDFTRGLKLVSAGEVEERRERYELFSGVKPQVDEAHRRRSLVLENAGGKKLTVDLDAGNEGVAFRYRLLEGAGEASVEEEASGFHVPAGAKGWISPYNGSTSSSPAYEEYYFAVEPGDPPPYSRGGTTRGWYFPALFQVEDAWMLLTESGTDGNYCGCHLAAADDGVYKIAFPFEDEGTRHVQHRPGTKPRHALPWTMPWRVVALGDRAGDILTSTLVTDLAEPSKIGDVSWIKPGRASWSWWSHPDGQNGTELYAGFITEAKTRGWEYSLLDAGWWKADVKALAEQAKVEGAGLLAWAHADGFYDADRRRRMMDEFVEAGFMGMKIDFWCTDRQEAMQAMTETLGEAAERKLLVNFHGCTLPRGWQRTWPNFMTAEAVLGAESYMFDERYPEKAAELNTILPFTRNVAGPMDFTPLGLGEKRYKRKTTAAHELAAGMIFNSGIVHYADDPEVHAGLPEEVKAILRDAPARWDETRCLAGEPGKMVVLARRVKEEWFIAGINGTDGEMPVELDLSGFGGKRAVFVREGSDALREMRIEEVKVDRKWSGRMAARGGFVMRLGR
jgi:alpha-glucosidase